MSNSEPRITISNNLVQALGDYLIQRPYREVAGLINALQVEVQASANFPGNVPSNPPVNQPNGQASQADEVAGSVQ